MIYWSASRFSFQTKLTKTPKTFFGKNMETPIKNLFHLQNTNIGQHLQQKNNFFFVINFIRHLFDIRLELTVKWTWAIFLLIFSPFFPKEIF